LVSLPSGLGLSAIAVTPVEGVLLPLITFSRNLPPDTRGSDNIILKHMTTSLKLPVTMMSFYHVFGNDIYRFRIRFWGLGWSEKASNPLVRFAGDVGSAWRAALIGSDRAHGKKTMGISAILLPCFCSDTE